MASFQFALSVFKVNWQQHAVIRVFEVWIYRHLRAREADRVQRGLFNPHQIVQTMGEAVQFAANYGYPPVATLSIGQGLTTRSSLAFEGTTQHVIWTDEEVPMDVYGECLIQTATTNGILMLTFTPLAGLTETVLQFLQDMWSGES